MSLTLIVGDLLRERARELPDKLFLWSGPDRMTYRDVDERSSRVAAGLAELGIGKGDRVAFVSANRTEMLELFFACAKVGAIQVPFNAALRGEFLRYQIVDCEAATLIVDAPGYTAAVELLDKAPALKRIVSFDEVDSSLSSVEVLPYESVRSSTSAEPSVDLAPGDLMSIVYTSGTTGMPKGCMLPHGYYVNIGNAMVESLGITADDVILTALPMFHTAARAMMVTAALVHRAACVVEPAFHPAGVLDRARETGATMFTGVGAMGMAVLAQPPSEQDKQHSLRQCAFIPFPPAMQQTFAERFGVDVYAELFGQTECVPATYTSVGDQRRSASCGKPAPYLEVKLVDDEDDEVPLGEVGEIVIRPRKPYVMFAGYWNKPDETIKAWRNLWHHTGDYGRADEDGYLTFVDRKKDALRRRGENVSSMQLELAIGQHPKLVEAAVHAIPSDMTEDDIKACVVVQPGEEITPQELFEFFQANLPRYAIPRYVEVVQELPKNAVMRIMKHLLRERGVTQETWDLHAISR